MHRKARARIEHALPRLKNWRIPRDCRPKGDGVHQVMLDIARLHNIAPAGQLSPRRDSPQTECTLALYTASIRAIFRGSSAMCAPIRFMT